MMMKLQGDAGPVSQRGADGDAANAPGDLASPERKIRDLVASLHRPIYTPESVHAVHALRYDWTGWLAHGASFPAVTADTIRRTAPLWEADGIAPAECRVRGDCVQIVFVARPEVTPVGCVARAKGRLQHALRQAGSPVTFSRKVAFRSLGENVADAVTGYLGKQVRKEGFADPRFARRLQAYTVEDPAVDLAKPTETDSGRYWYNLHLVLVTSGRVPIADTARLAAIRDATPRIAWESACRVKAFSVMPDHTHVALCGAVRQAPGTLALAFLNGLATALGRNRVWEDGYYVGTFSDYSMAIIRRVASGGAGGRK